MKRILVTGGTGMLGRALVREWTGRAIVFPVSARHFDLRDPDAVADGIRRLAPDWIIHTAAFTNVDGAEATPDEATAVNDLGTAHVAVAAVAAGASLAYLSTDYVFDGRKGTPYVETDPVAPQNVYGRTKLAGERHAEGVPTHLVIRTQGLFGREGRSFVRSILEAAQAGRAISVVNDVTTGVTYAEDLAFAIRRLVEGRATGTYHVSNTGAVVWADFARAVLDEGGHAHVPVTRTTASQFARPARRPPYSYLDSSRYAAKVGSALPPWREALKRYVKDVGRHDGPRE